MCVDTVVETAKEIKVIVKHFNNSPLHTEYLKESMRMLDLIPIHILNWSSTRMCGLLTACDRLTKILIPFIDTITQLNIKEETAQKLLAPLHLCCLLILGELEHIFCPAYLKPLDKPDVTISEVYGIIQASLIQIKSFKSVIAEEFVENLQFDKHGNLWAHIFLKSTSDEVVSTDSDSEIETTTLHGGNWGSSVLGGDQVWDSSVLGGDHNRENQYQPNVQPNYNCGRNL